MRATGLFLSLAVHCGAIGTSVIVGSGLAVRSPPTVPRVELEASWAEAPQTATAQEVPPITDEPATDDVFRTAPPDVEDLLAPLPAPDVAPDTDQADVPRHLLPTAWGQRVVMPAAATITEADVAPQVDTPEVVVAPDARAFVEASRLADNTPPEYPARERAAGREGTVVVLAYIDARGEVLDVELAAASPHPGLNRAAMRAVRGWRFTPASRLGVAMASRLEVPVVFRLTDR